MRCEWDFDNAMNWQADKQTEVDVRRLEALLKLHQAGLLDEEEARKAARRFAD